MMIINLPHFLSRLHLRVYKIVRLFFLFLLTEPRAFLVACRYFSSKEFYLRNLKVMSKDDLDCAIAEGKSVIRLGDGEIFLYYFGSIPGNQDYAFDLRKFFFRIVDEYKKDGAYILGLGTDYVSLSNEELKKRKLYKIWFLSKVFFYTKSRRDVSYFNAHFFYKTNGFRHTLSGQLKNKNVLVVANAMQIEKLKQSPFVTEYSVTFLCGPDKNGFKYYELLLQQILFYVAHEPENWRVILAIGPTSKVLVYELSKRGVVGYDIGQGVGAIYGESLLEKDLR